MNIAILGTGMVGNTIGTKLIQLGHKVKMGSRTPDNEKAVAWTEAAGDLGSHGTFADAAAFGEMIFNCTSGGGALDALGMAGAENLNGKIIVDISNPLDFSKGMPPSLFPNLSNTTSLGEEIQKAFPQARVVKTLNTVNCNLMVNPSALAGDHDMFICGDDAEARTTVAGLLKDWFGWQSVIDLGDMTAARGTEMLLPIWVRLYGTLHSPQFNFKIVH